MEGMGRAWALVKAVKIAVIKVTMPAPKPMPIVVIMAGLKLIFGVGGLVKGGVGKNIPCNGLESGFVITICVVINAL